MSDVRITGLFRYPVKSLSAAPLERVALTAGRGFPGDRRYALALPDCPFDPADPKPVSKFAFVVLARRAELARLRTDLDPEARRLRVHLDGRLVVEGDPDDPDGRAAIEDFFEGFVGDAIGGRPRLVAAPGHRFTDAGVRGPELAESVSVLNLASVRDLERRAGVRVDPGRFRANIHLDGLEPWAELSWEGRELTLGDVRLRWALPTTRCPATEVDPTTGARDLRVPKLLTEHFGHAVMGVYLDVRTDGVLRLGDGLG